MYGLLLEIEESVAMLKSVRRRSVNRHYCGDIVLGLGTSRSVGWRGAKGGGALDHGSISQRSGMWIDQAKSQRGKLRGSDP